MTDVLHDGHSDVHIVDAMGSDLSVVRAARVSFAGDKWTDYRMPSEEEHNTWRGEKDVKLIRYMADHGHGTPFEHTAVTFHIACPLFVRGQWHRHRIGWSYNEVSRRYTSEDIQFHTPIAWRMQNKTGNKQGSQFGIAPQFSVNNQYKNFIAAAEMLYDDLVLQGVANEQARMVLPQSMYTRFYATCNLRSLAHFLSLRDDEHAQPEIRAYARAMRDQVRDIFPVSIAALMGEHKQPEPTKLPWWRRFSNWFDGRRIGGCG